MDSDDERELDSDSGHHNSSENHDDDITENAESTSEKDQNSFSLTGFLFGNIDEKGQLEEDFLDEVNILITIVLYTISDDLEI